LVRRNPDPFGHGGFARIASRPFADALGDTALALQPYPSPTLAFGICHGCAMDWFAAHHAIVFRDAIASQNKFT
jgi:hypothetical protein